ncbi:uncharacterized protein LOC126803646 [Argentina anserina]|uniref:uncharacterized protein LOC126803646 n=1 Tax=Argentina anserina TaxID=57926 RepID=UPI0021768167|nr:uncharacterized protein LOC126803646 [Potentilla anserina]
MDKSWISWDKNSSEYQEKAKEFIFNSKKYARNPDLVRCPCIICQNRSTQTDEVLLLHLVKYGFDPMYKDWVGHGEPTRPTRSARTNSFVEVPHIDEDSEMHDAHHMYEDTYFQLPRPDGGETSTFTNLDDFYRNKVLEAEVPLYPGCTKYTKLSATLNLYKLKADSGLSNVGFDNFLKEFKNMLPKGNTCPDSLYTVKKTLKDFDLGYEKIHTCINDCCLFRGDNLNLQKCPECQASRWKVNPRTKKIEEGTLAKVLRYFPIIPRLQRMFLSSTIGEQLTWHSSHHSQDGMMRHPVDSVQWSFIDKKWAAFASDPRNLRFGLATDGFNPFSEKSTKHSTWPVILVIYNLPPNVCMSSENLMLSLLIPGPRQPGNDIDVYLQPLRDDLVKLWNGVEMYDAYSKAMFNLRAILLWTINDFPAYGNLSGLAVKGEFGCPVCG